MLRSQTASSIGWSSSLPNWPGEIGAIGADGYLTIVDRKKEIIINAAGKNMLPSNIENAVMAKGFSRSGRSFIFPRS
jgi:long-chain acyl-CoA synthetase